jgi:hypothetical protein
MTIRRTEMLAVNVRKMKAQTVKMDTAINEDGVTLIGKDKNLTCFSCINFAWMSVNATCYLLPAGVFLALCGHLNFQNAAASKKSYEFEF